MKYTLLIIFALLLHPFATRAQRGADIAPGRPAPVTVPDSVLVEQPDEMPEFPGGNAKLYSFLGSNLRYPPKAAQIDLQGQVIVEFVVCEDGTLCNEKIIKSFDSDCSKEVLRIVKKMPAWKAGTKNGKKVKTKFRLPVQFRLSE